MQGRGVVLQMLRSVSSPCQGEDEGEGPNTARGAIHDSASVSFHSVGSRKKRSLHELSSKISEMVRRYRRNLDCLAERLRIGSNPRVAVVERRSVEASDHFLCQTGD